MIAKQHRLMLASKKSADASETTILVAYLPKVKRSMTMLLHSSRRSNRGNLLPSSKVESGVEVSSGQGLEMTSREIISSE